MELDRAMNVSLQDNSSVTFCPKDLPANGSAMYSVSPAYVPEPHF